MVKRILVVLVLALLLSGCGGGGSSSNQGTLVSITVTPVAPVTTSIAAGTSAQFRAIGKYSNNSSVDLTDSVAWSSSNSAIATVSNTAGERGKTTAVSLGACKILATSGGISGSADLTVETLLSITVTPDTSVGIVGSSQAFTATGVLPNNASQDLTRQVDWRSSDDAIATVSIAGVANSKALGAVNVIATLGSISGKATLTVASVVSIAVEPATPTLNAGASQQFTATATLSDAGKTTMPVTSLVKWSSAAPAIVAINQNTGIASALSPGTTTVTATYLDGPAGSTSVTVLAPDSIAVTPLSPIIAAGSTQQFSAMGTFADKSTKDLTDLVVWNSSDLAIATISSAGLATAKANGSTTITATMGAISFVTTLTVRTLSSIVVAPATASIAIGSSVQLAATGTFDDNSTQDLTNVATWSSSAPGGASVNTKGVVSGIALGSATVTGTFAGKSASTTVTVTQTAPPTNRAYVTNFGSNSLSVIDTLRNTVLTNIPVGTGPQGVAVNSTNNRAYVANFSVGTLSVINIVSNTVVATVTVGQGAWGVVVNPALSRAYVTNSNGGTLSVIDTTNNTVLRTVAVGTGPRGVAVNSATNLVYVSNSGSNTVSVVDAASNSVTATVNVGSTPQDIALNPSTSRAYVANSFGSSLSVINTVSNALVTTVPVGANPQGVAVNLSANRAYVANSGSSTVFVIDTSNNTFLLAIGVGTGPQGIAVQSAANRVFVANNGSNSVSVIDTLSNKVVATIQVGNGPKEVAFLP